MTNISHIPIEEGSGAASFDARTPSLIVALTLLLVASSVLNSVIFPQLATLNPAARELSTYCGAAFFLVLAAIAYRAPFLFKEAAWGIGSLAVIALSLALLVYGMHAESSVLVAIGAPFGGIGGAWFLVLACIAFTCLDTRGRIVGMTCAALTQCLVSTGLEFVDLSLGVAVAVYFACYAVSYYIARPHVVAALDAIRNGGPLADMGVLNPSSFLPLTHPAYVAILLFSTASGFALSFGSVSSTPVQAPLSLIPLAVIFGMVVVAKRHLNADSLFNAATLLTLAGLLLVPFAITASADPLHLSTAFLISGTSCFDLLVFLLVISMGARNVFCTIPLAALTKAVNWLGIALGAWLGHAINAKAAHMTDAVMIAVALIAFLFVAYNFVVLKSFSFEAAIEGIQPVAAPTTRTQAAQRFAQQCEQAAARYRLTPRETDVFELLAYGRNSSVIEERLVLSRNTIKTHVRNIYAKFGVHSQQELIDLVEHFELDA